MNIAGLLSADFLKLVGHNFRKDRSMYLSTFCKCIPFLLLPLITCECRKTDPWQPKVEATRNHKTNLQIPGGVCIGNSIIAGHPWRYSGLELNSLGYPDSAGQISYELTRLTKYAWSNRGWGGQTTVQIKRRFLRDAIGDSSDPGDGRGALTLRRKPSCVVIEGGVNDIQDHISLDTIKANLAWMASVCRRNQIRCIVLNCVGQGYGVYDQDQIGQISRLNDWLADRALDSVGATVVDINSIWNSGRYKGVSVYGNDNVHFSTLVNPGDGIHFTRAGYDSVADAIWRVAGL
ncbi:MAG TPA: GDSL-type esterase/lipase family protein [Puia sp.]|nr:GDSL-type esterase/lipase family protein [Puia sp.]